MPFGVSVRVRLTIIRDGASPSDTKLLQVVPAADVQNAYY